MAPYWFDDNLILNNTGNGSFLFNKTGNASLALSVYYRETNQSLLLTRATQETRRAFPNIIDFNATHLFIVTWVIVDPEDVVSEMVII